MGSLKLKGRSDWLKNKGYFLLRTVKITRCIPQMYFYKLLKIIKYTMLHTKCKMLHPKCTMLHTKCTMLHTQCTMLHTKCTVLHTKYTMLHTKCTMLHTKLNISHYTNVAWTLVLFLAHPTSDNAMMSCNIIARYKILMYHLWASFFCVFALIYSFQYPDVKFTGNYCFWYRNLRSTADTWWYVSRWF